jgi:cytosine deaminase
MTFDLLLRQGLLNGQGRPVDIGLRDGRIAAIAPALPPSVNELALDGRLVIPGFVETHIHLDKSCLLHQTGVGHRDLGAAVQAVAAAKRAFTLDDMLERARATLERAITFGTNRLRTHVEVDPRVGLMGLKAMLALRKEYAWAVDLQICVFPQEGLLNDPGCEALLRQSLKQGADLIGGAPYMDSNPLGQLERIFAIARDFDVDIDLHLDFDLDTKSCQFLEVCRLTERFGWQGRVAIGHVSKLALLQPVALEAALRHLAEAGVAVTALPATDLFLLGRGMGAHAPRALLPLRAMAEQGVNFSISSNNILNPFTPFGDCSLPRMGNLHANVAQVDGQQEIQLVFEAITSRAAGLLNLPDYDIKEGGPATFVIIDCIKPEDVIRCVASPLYGYKDGNRSFTRPPALLHSENWKKKSRLPVPQPIADSSSNQSAA